MESEKKAGGYRTTIRINEKTLAVMKALDIDIDWILSRVKGLEAFPTQAQKIAEFNRRAALPFVEPQDREARGTRRSDAQIVADTEELARYLLLEVYGFEAPADAVFRYAKDPRSKASWARAVHIMEMLTQAEVADAVSAVDDDDEDDTDPPAAQAAVEEPPHEIRILYRNWRGEVGMRTVQNPRLEFRASEWHGPDPVWCIVGLDPEKGAERDFAVGGILSFDPDTPAPQAVDAETAGEKEAFYRAIGEGDWKTVAHILSKRLVRAETRATAAEAARDEAVRAVDAGTAIRSRATAEFCVAAGIKPSDEARCLPQDVKLYRMDAALRANTGEPS